MSYFDSGSSFFCNAGPNPLVDIEMYSGKDPVSFALEVESQIPFHQTRRETVYRRKQPSVARAKWDPVSFKNDEAVRFRQQLTEKIVDLRKELSQANAVVTFPDHISQEATLFAPPKYGLKWEIFDVKKHADLESIQELQRRKKLAMERVAYEKALTDMRHSSQRGNASQQGLTMAWGEILSSDV